MAVRRRSVWWCLPVPAIIAAERGFWYPLCCCLRAFLSWLLGARGEAQPARARDRTDLLQEWVRLESWAGFAKKLLRLAFKRKQWPCLGTLLREIRERGETWRPVSSLRSFGRRSKR